jgi:septal ring factor EnvC (AmiA/AmiB activator)
MTKLELMERLLNGNDFTETITDTAKNAVVRLSKERIDKRDEHDELVKKIHNETKTYEELLKESTYSKRFYKEEIKTFYELIENTLKNSDYDYFIDSKDSKKFNVKVADGNGIDTSDVICSVKVSTRQYLSYATYKEYENYLEGATNNYKIAKKINEMELKISQISKKINDSESLVKKLDKIDSLLDNLSEILD